MKAKFRFGDKVQPSKRGKSFWKNVLGDNFKGRIVSIGDDSHDRLHSIRKLYKVRSGSYEANLFSYELQKRRSK
jgi:hypothetical protein